MVKLIEPKSHCSNNEEQRKLNDSGQYKDELVDPVNGPGGADTFECLPPKQLRKSPNISCAVENGHDPPSP
jgi:hypothetical protein